VEIELAFNFIYTMHYNGLVIFLTFFSIINMVHGLNHRPPEEHTIINDKDFLVAYSTRQVNFSVAFYIYHNLLKHMQ